VTEFKDIKAYEKHHITGSSYICNPPVIDTDIDYVVLVYDKCEALSELAASLWNVQSDDDYPENDDFCSVRKGNVNLIVTECDQFYGRFVAATEISKKLNLTNKPDRINLFRSVLYGELQ